MRPKNKPPRQPAQLRVLISNGNPLNSDAQIFDTITDAGGVRGGSVSELQTDGGCFRDRQLT